METVATTTTAATIVEGVARSVPELWFYMDPTTGERKGPLSTQVLSRLLEKGLLGINGNTMVWRAGTESWSKLIEVDTFKRIAELHGAQWYYLDGNHEQRGPILTRLLLHKVQEGELDGFTLVYGGQNPDWKKLSDVPALREAMHKIAEEEEALERVKQNEALLQQQTFIPDSSSNNDQQHGQPISSTAATTLQYFEGDDGTRYRWDEQEQGWTEDDNQSHDSTTAKKKRAREDESDDEGDEDVEDKDEDDHENDETTSQDSGGNNPNEASMTEDKSKTQKKRKNRRNKKRKSKVPSTWVYVDGLPSDVTFEEIKQHFSKVGLIAISPYDQQPRIKIYKEPDSELCKGDCMICYVAEESVQLAVDILNDGYIRPRYKISVTRATFDNPTHFAPSDGTTFKSKSKGPSTLSQSQIKVARNAIKQALAWNEDDDIGISRSSALRIIVLEGMFSPTDFANPQFEIDLEEDIASECEKYGEIEKLTIFSKNPRGIIIVKFTTAFSAQECIRVMNGRYFAGKQIKSYFWDGVTNFSIIAEGEEAEEKEEMHRMDEFGDWLDQEQEELPEEFQLQTE